MNLGMFHWINMISMSASNPSGYLFGRLYKNFEVFMRICIPVGVCNKNSENLTSK
jgi:hypothetical protein